MSKEQDAHLLDRDQSVELWQWNWNWTLLLCVRAKKKKEKKRKILLEEISKYMAEHVTSTPCQGQSRRTF